MLSEGTKHGHPRVVDVKILDDFMLSLKSRQYIEWFVYMSILRFGHSTPC